MKQEYKFLELSALSTDGDLVKLNELGQERWEGFAALAIGGGRIKVLLKREVLRAPDGTVVHLVDTVMPRGRSG